MARCRLWTWRIHGGGAKILFESLKRILKPGGELVIETGDSASLSAEDHYRPFYLPDHLSFASEHILRGILANLDFEIIAIRKYPSVKLNPIAITKEVAKIFLPRHKSRISHYLHWKRYSQTDMYIRARLKSA
jgi:hypothetical protein